MTTGEDSATAPVDRLDEEQCWAFLERHDLGRVAFLHLGETAVFPVNYVVDGRRIVFRAAPGTKLDVAKAQRRAAFEVDEASALFETGTSVVVQGVLRVLRDERERLEHLPLRTWLAGRDHFVAVEARRVTGRRIRQHLPADGVVADGG